MRLFIAKGDFLATIEGDDDDITISERCRKKMLCANFVRLVRLVCMCVKVMQMLRTELNIKLFSQCRMHA